MMPEEAVLDFEIRHLFSETAEALLAEVMAGLPEGIEIALERVAFNRPHSLRL
ncbi:hypothetical protein SAMN04488026_10742 [Aliiruegeria lutimaris]|uniref:Uncharacterized protein n=1 Tax=Aliiruegeria lutimaris TaxID=571298 RepID=A0A1G9IEP5_9RHOB|nr:hypothetical protein SAMN04488026_10742 [Aliiruegeria lutimaris]